MKTKNKHIFLGLVFGVWSVKYANVNNEAKIVVRFCFQPHIKDKSCEFSDLTGRVSVVK